jgi:hypothetical protein
MALESTDASVTVKSKLAMFVESTDDVLSLKAKKAVTIESTDDKLVFTASKGAAFSSTTDDVLIESKAKKLMLKGSTGVEISDGVKVTVSATKIDLNGIVEVNGALLVKGEFTPLAPLALESTMKTELLKVEAARAKLEVELKAHNAETKLKAEKDLAEIHLAIVDLTKDVELRAMKD